jgi:proton glutamate symport protein
MPNTIATPKRGEAQLFVILSLAGAALWLVGVASSLFSQATLGAAMRATALGLLAVAGLRKPSLIFWTFLGMLAGVELGVDAPHVAVQTHFLGDLFLRLIRMVVAPLLFASITTGIAGHGLLRSIGRVAIKALIYFEIVTTLGLLIGVFAMTLSGAGWGIALPAAQSAEGAVQSVQTWQQTFVNLFPENIAQAVAQNQILQVAIFAVLFGAALAMLPEQKRAPLVSVLQSLADTMFQLTRLVMFLAPLAAGAALAYSVASMGLATLVPLVKLVLTYYAALAAFSLLVMLPTLVAFRIPLRRFIAAVAEPAAIGFATTSSEAALPLAMERMEEFGVPRWIVSFVIPTGYSFNMTGGSVYLSMAAVFTTQAAGVHLTLFQYCAMLGTLMLASKGVAGVPRAALVVLLATAGAIHIPTAPILLILGIDTVMDMGRTLMNVVGNCMASVIIARSEGSLRDSSEAVSAYPDSASCQAVRRSKPRRLREG